MSGKDFTQQVVDLRQQRDYLERRLKLQADLNEGLHQLMRDNTEFLDRQRERLNDLGAILDLVPGCERDPKRVLKWIAERIAQPNQGTSARPPAESVCVGEMIKGPDGSAFLRCTNCAIVVAKLSAAQLLVLNFPDPDGLQAHWREEWAAHTARERVATDGAHGVTRPTEDRMTGIDQLDQPANPNAGVKQAYPNGRWP